MFRVKSNPFERFYNKSVKIIKIETGSGYSDRGRETITELAELKADIQPYGGGLAEKEYGLSEECQFRLFCNNNEHLTVGNYVESGGIRYKIIYIAVRDMGAEVLLQFVR